VAILIARCCYTVNMTRLLLDCIRCLDHVEDSNANTVTTALRSLGDEAVVDGWTAFVVAGRDRRTESTGPRRQGDKRARREKSTSRSAACVLGTCFPPTKKPRRRKHRPDKIGLSSKQRQVSRYINELVRAERLQLQRWLRSLRRRERIDESDYSWDSSGSS
jgi:hypothetical protein